MTVTAGRAPASGSPTPGPRRWEDSRRSKHRPRSLVLILVLTLAAGLLSAAVAAPLVIGAGLAAKA
ncbi:MAG: hypothetical protein JWN96_1310, partial [Mycobacterium sp.]|nr:hypothetical protein [Mycobacterium sp.]